MSTTEENQTEEPKREQLRVNLFGDAEIPETQQSFERTESSINVTTPTPPKFHSKLAKVIWMVSVNLYDLVGLLELSPCGTLHSMKPYVSYKMKYQ